MPQRLHTVSCYKTILHKPWCLDFLPNHIYTKNLTLRMDKFCRSFDELVCPMEFFKLWPYWLKTYNWCWFTTYRLVLDYFEFLPFEPYNSLIASGLAWSAHIVVSRFILWIIDTYSIRLKNTQQNGLKTFTLLQSVLWANLKSNQFKKRQRITIYRAEE